MKGTYIGIILLSLLVIIGCDDKVDPLITDLDFKRVLGASNFKAEPRSVNTIRLTWEPREDVAFYVIELHEDSLQFNNLVYTAEVQPDEVLPYYQFTTTLSGETLYSARLMVVSAVDKDDSKWATTTLTTPAENIYLATPLENVQDTYATLIWPANSSVSHVVINPGNINREISQEELELGEVTIENLSGSTEYTVTLYNGVKRRGVQIFKTLGEANVFPEDDLAVLIANAPEGKTFLLAPGEYTLSATVVLNKSVILEGQKPFDRPLVIGNFVCGEAKADHVLFKDIIFDGNGAAQFINSQAGCDLPSLTIDKCEIRNYGSQLIYNSNIPTVKYGNIKITNSYIHSFGTSGGDGIDFRDQGNPLGSLTVENTTFAKGFRAFLRMQVPAMVSFKNCTFYQISNVDNSNNSGLFRMTGAAGANNTLSVTNCLFVETGVANPTNVQSGNFVRNSGNMTATPTYSKNNIYSCYNLLVGLYTTAAQVSATELNPQFEDASNGNFKINNTTLIDEKIGDQSWQ